MEDFKGLKFTGAGRIVGCLGLQEPPSGTPFAARRHTRVAGLGVLMNCGKPFRDKNICLYEFIG